MNRYLHQPIVQDLAKKMVFVTGPRQVGKTTLAQELGKAYREPLYLNYDFAPDRARMLATDWHPKQDYLVFDEIHSMPNWKMYLKGVFDTKPKSQALIVTGSARLDTFRQTGESLAGRYFSWHLHPFSVREISQQGIPSDEAFANLERFGGFPEPLFEGTEAGRNRWQNQYFTDLVREDILEFSRIHEVKAMRELMALLRTRTGSTLSMDSLGRDLSISANTVRSYISILEALHIVFLVKPYSQNIAKAQVKATKLYFYDWAYIAQPPNDSGARFENLVASHLLKHVQFLNDSEGKQLELKFLRTTNNKEIDFVISTELGVATHFIEVKLTDEKPTFALKQMAKAYPDAQAIQLVRNAKAARWIEGVSIEPAAAWLNTLT
jgi:uncharacterized protein